MEWLVVLIAGILPLAVLLLLPPSNIRRVALVLIIFVFGLRYLQWRVLSFPWDDGFTRVEWWWWLLVLAIEIAVMLEVALFLATITWLSDRKPEADKAERLLRSNFHDHGIKAVPSIDIFLTTYNEGAEILEKSILGALEVDYPNFRVCVLDDGRRDWLKRFCVKAGAVYISRDTNQGAKAGNINNALRQSRADLIMILDADFVCFRHALWRTAGLFDDQRLATVQTPQNFFNPDALQHNLGISSTWSDEQSYFFRLIARGRDSLGVTFCCGSCSVHRRAALAQVGGFPLASITEDILLTIGLCARGWRTIYLEEPISVGLAPESLESFFIQRKRWGRGGIQVAWLMLGEKGLTAIQKIFFFPFSWITQYNSRLFFQLIPVLFFFTGLAPIPDIESANLVQLQLPFLLSLVLSMTILSNGYYLPIYSEGISLFSSFELAPEILASMVKPFGAVFSVTPKGLDSMGRRSHLYTRILIPSSILLGLNIAILFQIVFALGGVVTESSQVLLAYGCAWCCFNVVLLVLSVCLCLQRPQPRLEHRMLIERPCTLVARPINGGATTCSQAWLVDLSLTGALCELSGEVLKTLECQWALCLDDGLEIPVDSIYRRRAHRFAFAFPELSISVKRRLVGYAFSGAFVPAEQAQVIRPMHTLATVAASLAN
jgi:cellulose synthase (UDP-forming)